MAERRLGELFPAAHASPAAHAWSGDASGADGGGEAGLRALTRAGCDSRQPSAPQLAPVPAPAPIRQWSAAAGQPLAPCF